MKCKLYWGILSTLMVAQTLFCGLTKAQSLPLGPYTSSDSSSIIFEVDEYGVLSSTGTLGTGTLSLSGAGTKMYWYPAQSAFRAGTVTDGVWDDSNVGLYSVAFGLETTASGEASFALGENTSVSGIYSVAMGNYNYATGPGTAMFGQVNGSDGSYDAVFGVSNYTYAFATAIFGVGNTANGNDTLASGWATNASSECELVAGSYNVGGGSGGEWVSTDPIFELGNGGDGLGDGNPAATTTSDAFVVYKNGNATLQGVLTAAPGGDIPMYSGD